MSKALENKTKEQTLQEDEEFTSEPTLEPIKTLSREEYGREKKPEEIKRNLDTEDLEEADKKTRVLMNIPDSIYQKIKDEAHERDISRASVVREALREYFAGLENVEKRNPNKTDEIEKIKGLIDESTDWFGRFDLDHFLENAQEQELVGDEVWTQELLEAYLIPKIRQASEGLLSPSLDENCNKCITALQLGEENVKFLAEKLGLDITEEHEIEETFELI